MRSKIEFLKKSGNDLFQKESIDEALVQYSEALRLAANEDESDEEVRLTTIKCLTNRAQCFARLGKRETARLDYDKALLQFKGHDDPTLIAKAYYNSGFNFEALGLLEDAIHNYSKSLSFKPTNRRKVEEQLHTCEEKLLQLRGGSGGGGDEPHYASGDGKGDILVTPSKEVVSSPGSPKCETATRVVHVNFSDSPTNGSAEEKGTQPPATPELHPVVKGLSSATIQSSPLKSEVKVDNVAPLPPLEISPFYDGQGIIVSNSNSLDMEDAVETEVGPGVRPTQSKQKNDIDKLLQQRGVDAGLEPNSVWFLLNKEWWDLWRAYVNAATTALAASSPSAERKSFAAAATAALAVPSGIDNWKLTTFSTDETATDEEKSTYRALRQSCRYSTCSLHLRQGLVENVDFVALPRDAWEALHTWYGGGPPLPRLAIPLAEKDFLSGFESISTLDGAIAAADQNQNESTNFNALNISTSKINLYPAKPPTVSELLGLGSGLGRSPGGSSVMLGGSSTDSLLSSSGGEVSYIEEIVFNDCGLSVKGKKGNIKTGDSCFVCRKYSYSTCKRCKAVHYCSESCQIAHWKYHKTWCAQADEFANLPFLDFQRKVAVGRRGKVGLHNLGNSCYLNSSLQCLSHMKQLTTHFLTDHYKLDVNKENFLGTGGLLAEEYALLMQDLWFRKDASIQPLTFKKLIGRLQPDWAGFAQQDAAEVILFLLDKLHEDLNRVKSKPYVEKKEGDGSSNDMRIATEQWKAFSSRDDSIVRDIVGSFYRSHVKCPHCNKQSVSFEYQTLLQVEIPRSTQRTFRVFLIPWRGLGGVGDFFSSGPLELAVEVDRLATIYAIKKAIERRLKQIHQKLNLASTEIMLCEYSQTLHQVVTYLHPQYDDEGVSRLREGISLAAYLVPSDMYQSISESSVGFIPLQQRTITLNPSTKIIVARFPVLLPAVLNMSCWKARNLIWKHIVGFVRRDSALGKLLERADKLERATLDMTLALILPLRMVMIDRVDMKSKTDGVELKPMVSNNGLNTDEQCEEIMLGIIKSNDEACKKISALGLSISGGFKVASASKALGSILPVDKHIVVTNLLRNGSLCMDWSGEWLEQLDIEALLQQGAVRDESAIQAFASGPTALSSATSTPVGMRRRSLSGSENPITLEQCLRVYTKEEILSKLEAWYCPQCKDHVEGSSRVVSLMSAQLPEVLIIQLKRFESRDVSSLLGRPPGGIQHREKIETFVDFPLEGLNVAPFCDDMQAERTMYDLFAVCNHYGRMGFGHYSAFARDCMLDGNLSDTWTFFDDNDVRVNVSAEEVKSSAAYILFYKRRS